MTAPYALGTTVHDGVAVVTIDLPSEPMNVMNRAVRAEMLALLDRLQHDETVRAAVLISGKADSFIAGADIEELMDLGSPADAERLSRDGQALAQALERSRVPFVAAVHGACTGLGVEAVLACRYRIVTDHPQTVLALPAVQIGLIPGAGGTQRLPRLVGLRAALDMIVTGRMVPAMEALKTGLADEMVHPAILREIAIARARDVAAGRLTRARRDKDAMTLLLDGNPVGRRIVLRNARADAAKKLRGHYPAPLAALDAIEMGLERGMQAGLREEARLFGDMAGTAVSRNLMSLHFTVAALKNDPGVHGPTPPALPIRKIGLLGAGYMGAGIASVAVQQRTMVRMKDADTGHVARGYAAVRGVLSESLRTQHITSRHLDDAMSLLSGTTDYSGFGSVDLVIEAVAEDGAAKHEVLRETELVIPATAIYASSASSIPIVTIAEASARPERVLGVHFFTPARRTPLLEVVVTPRTDRQVTAAVVAYGKQLGRTVIVVSDGPGGYVNRILTPYLNEAGRLLEQGAAIEAVDGALTAFGFPAGPVTLLDEIGLDVAGSAGHVMQSAFGTRLAPPWALQKVVATGRYGRKSKRGFYGYDHDGRRSVVDQSVYACFSESAERSAIPEEEMRRRTVHAMLNEAARCLEEGIIRSPRDGDVGAVYGAGFPAFRGGPFRYMDSIGVAELARQLEDLNDRFPGRFEPAGSLVDMARAGSSFYPSP